MGTHCRLTIYFSNIASDKTYPPMKKLLTALFFLAIYTTSVKAQYFTARLAGGYAWPGFQNSEGIMAPLIDPFNPGVDALAPMANVKDTMNGQPASYKAVHGSYGQGLNLTLGLGYSINDYFNVELGISYLKSATISSSETRQLTVDNGIGFTYIPYYLTAAITTNAVGVSISPSVTVKAPIKHSKVLPYARAGISLPIYGNLTDHITIDQNAPAGLQHILDTAPYFLGKHTEVTLKTQGTVSVGFNGAIGVNYTPLPFLSVFFEVNGQHLVTKAQSSQITQWDADGKSLIAERGVYRTHFNYVDQLNGSSNNSAYNTNTDLNKPKDDTRPVGPFSNLGLNVGVIFMLSKKTLHSKDKDAASPNKK
jgi:Outer membrane protein beta-barrel domain